MTNTIVINTNNRAIEITKKFATAAKRFGSDEYNDLQAARRDYPNYRVETKSVRKKADSFKGLTYDYMESYIIRHDDTLLSVFNELRGKTNSMNDDYIIATASYGEIKKWFIKQFPELEIKRKTIDEILGNTAA